MSRKSNIICFSGTHRNGKTTLAKAVAEKMGGVFIPTELSKMEMWDKIGTPSDNYCFAERLAIQEEMFGYIVDKILLGGMGHKGFVCFDRSPMDLIGYLLSNIDHTCSPIFDKRVKDLIYNIMYFCKHEIKHSFLLELNPYIPFSPEEMKNGKIYNSFAYRKSISNHIFQSYCDNIAEQNYSIISPDPASKNIRNNILAIMKTL